MKCREYVHLGPCCWDNLFSRVKWQWHICTTTDNYTAIHFQVSALFIQGFTQPSQMKAAGNCSELKKIQAPHDLGVRYLICLATYLSLLFSSKMDFCLSRAKYFIDPRRWTSIDLRSASLFVRRLLDDDFSGR